MSLLYKFPKLYDYVVDKYLTDVPDTSIPDDLAEILALDRLEKDALVLDLACGTGWLTLWLAAQRPDVQVIGVDISATMLAQATQQSQVKGLQKVAFINQSPLTLTPAALLASRQLGQDPQAPVALIVCSHGFSAMKDYEAIFYHTLSLLANGGVYAILDSYYPKLTPATLLATCFIDGPLFGVNQFRKPFLPMQRELSGFMMREKAVVHFGFLPCTYYVAKGVKHSQS